MSASRLKHFSSLKSTPSFKYTFTLTMYDYFATLQKYSVYICRAKPEALSAYFTSLLAL